MLYLHTQGKYPYKVKQGVKYDHCQGKKLVLGLIVEDPALWHQVERGEVAYSPLIFSYLRHRGLKLHKPFLGSHRQPFCFIKELYYHSRSLCWVYEWFWFNTKTFPTLLNQNLIVVIFAILFIYHFRNQMKQGAKKMRIPRARTEPRKGGAKPSRYLSTMRLKCYSHSISGYLTRDP